MDLLYEHVQRRQQQAKLTADRLEEAADKLLKERLDHMAIIPAGKTAMAPGGDTRAAAPTPPAPPAAAVVSGDHNLVQIHQDLRRTVNINIFGGERTDHITPAKVMQLIEATPEVASPVDMAMQVLVSAAMLIYSDLEYPENITCYIPNKKNPEALVHGESGWEIQPVRMVAPAMTRATTKVLATNQPLPWLEGCERMREYTEHGELFAALVRNREVYEKGQGQMKTILVRNRALLERALRSLPVAGAD